jgi:hypothetical protein
MRSYKVKGREREKERVVRSDKVKEKEMVGERDKKNNNAIESKM